ncbi:MAG TPA: hypothetical protein VIV11_23850 [Kofleriaceae bacterium]
MRYAFLILFALVACGKGSKENRKICEQAADKFTSCVSQILGPEMAAQTRAKDGVAECAKDDKTVTMYRACLPKTDCDEFMTCMEDYARNSAPAIAADKPRVEQCQQHVKDGLRGIAMQVVMLGEHARRNSGDKEHAQRCTMDESKPWESCIEPAELEEVKRYGVQRQSECETWSAELAACILRLPGAKDCKPDEFPMWRLPLDRGSAGPKIAWSTNVVDDADYDDDVRFEWTANRDLVVRDDNSLRVLRDGKQRWQAAIAGVDVELALTPAAIAARGTDDARGVHLFDLATGKATRALEGTYVSLVSAAANDRILIWTGNSEIHELTPAACTKPKTCAKKLGALEDDGTMYLRSLSTWRDSLVLGHGYGVLVTDRRATPRLTIHLENNEVVLAGDQAIIADDKGVVILSLPHCRALGSNVYLPSTRGGSGDPPEDCADCVLARGGCVVARRAVSWVSTVDPDVLPDGSVAFNDDGITEKTHHFGEHTEGWEVQTNATGRVAGDADHVYTVSTGLDGDGPFRLLALSRDNGKVVWETELPASRAPPDEIRVTARNGMIAVRIDGTIYVIELARAT